MVPVSREFKFTVPESRVVLNEPVSSIVLIVPVSSQVLSKRRKVLGF